MSQPTPEQIAQFQQDQQTRAALQQAFAQFYGNVISFLQKLSFPENIKLYMYQNLDQGAMWAKVGIDALQFNFQSQAPTAPQESKPEDEAKEEAPKEACESQQEEKPQE